VTSGQLLASVSHHEKAPASAVEDKGPGRCITESKSRWSGREDQTGRQSRHQATKNVIHEHSQMLSASKAMFGKVKAEGDHIAMEGKRRKVKAGY
jgi:hypothetical protein